MTMTLYVVQEGKYTSNALVGGHEDLTPEEKATLDEQVCHGHLHIYRSSISI